MAVRCPNCDRYQTYNQRRLFILLGIIGVVLGGGLLYLLLIKGWGAILILPIFVVLGAGFYFLIAAYRMRAPQKCKNCKKHFNPENVEPRDLDRLP